MSSTGTESLEVYILAGVKWALAGLGAIAMWIVRGWDSKLSRMEERMSEIERTYIGREEMERHVGRLELKLDRVLDRLDHKVDK